MTVLQLEKFTPQVLSSIEVAQRQAQKLGRSIAGAEDLLFGVMYYERLTPPHKVVVIMKDVFKTTRYDVDQAVRQISLRPVDDYDSNDQLTKGANTALEEAAARAREGVFANRFDVMVGLARCKDPILLRVLEILDISPIRLELVMCNSLFWTAGKS